MGPPIYIGGNCRLACFVKRELKLQWGHRFTSVETPWRRQPRPREERASMGPPIYIGGNKRGCQREIGYHTASMGPPIYIGGNIDTEWHWTGWIWASMGPPIYIGGNMQPWRCSTPGEKLQWGHRFTSVETEYYPSGLKERQVWLQWGHRFTSVETLTMAHEESPEKRLQWGHRFTSVETVNWGTTKFFPISFNGATDLHRWKRSNARGNQRPDCELQWGHRFTSVETQCSASAGHGCGRASMGPPIYIGGNNSVFGVFERQEDAASMGPPIYIGGNVNPNEKTQPT